MAETKKSRFLNEFKDYLMITLGVLLVAIGVYFFKFPNHISTGGVTGLAVVLHQAFPAITASTYTTIFNLIFLVLGFIVLGKEFGIRTVYGSLLLSGFLELFDLLFEVFHVPADFLPLTVTTANPQGEVVLELVFAVAFPAVGAAILFYNHSSTGGTDVVAQIIRKYTNIDSGKALILADFILVLLTFYNFESHAIAWTTGLLSVTGMVIKDLVVDKVIESINQSKYFLIVTTHKDEVADFIIQELHRSATVWECEGAYTHHKEYALVAVMNRYQGYQLRTHIRNIDKKAFIIVTSSSDIIGGGFRQV